MFAAGVLVGWALWAGSSSGGADPRAAPGSLAPDPVLELGTPATSSLGNSITALSWDSEVDVNGRAYARAEVEWCAGQEQVGQVRNIISLWSVSMSDGSQVLPEPGGVGPDSLARSGNAQVVPGDCARGFIDFDLTAAAEPALLTFSGQEVFRWVLEPV